jgi:hypothetical protein
MRPTSPRTEHDLRRAILRSLVRGGDSRFHMQYFYARLTQEGALRVTPHEVMSELWSMLADGLVYIDYTQPASENWSWLLTTRGGRVASGQEDYEPDDPDQFIQNLHANAPHVDDLIVVYARDALRAYRADANLASVVMLGVGAERAFLRLGDSFKSWLPPQESARFAEVFDSSRRNYVDKFREFRKYLEPRKGQIPDDFAENMALTLDSVLDLLRVNRNEAGHPTGRLVSHDDAYTSLQLFARLVRKLYTLHDFFKANPHPRA